MTDENNVASFEQMILKEVLNGKYNINVSIYIDKNREKPAFFFRTTEGDYPEFYIEGNKLCALG